MAGTDAKLTGNQVKFIRTKLGESQAAFAARMAVSQPVIFRIEKKADLLQTGPEIILISQIAEANGIAVPSPEACADEVSKAVA